jgi:hypothetical protein
MQVPAGYEGDFLWVEYLKKTKSQAAPLSLFLHKDEYKHAFKVILSYIFAMPKYPIFLPNKGIHFT